MAEYISREAAETLMCDACEYDCTPHKRASGQSLITADDCYHLRDLYKIPAADVAPVVHAHWKEIEHEGETTLCECTSCGDWILFHYEYSPDYCPTCGAKMDESEFAKDANVLDKDESESEK